MNQGELLLLLVLLLLPDVEACDGGVICDKNGCSLTNKDECPQSCTNAEYSFSDSDRTDTGTKQCECSLCGDNHNACVEAYGAWVCDGLGPISSLYTGSFGCSC